MSANNLWIRICLDCILESGRVVLSLLWKSSLSLKAEWRQQHGDECELICPAVTLKSELVHSELYVATTWMLLAWQLAWVSLRNTGFEY